MRRKALVTVIDCWLTSFVRLFGGFGNDPNSTLCSHSTLQNVHAQMDLARIRYNRDTI